MDLLVFNGKYRLTSASPEGPEGIANTEALFFRTEDDLIGRGL